jgi:hypothetical protein
MDALHNAQEIELSHKKCPYHFWAYATHSFAQEYIFNLKKNRGLCDEEGNKIAEDKSALLWIVPESGSQMREEARKMIAWEDVKDERLKWDEILKSTSASMLH